MEQPFTTTCRAGRRGIRAAYLGVHLVVVGGLRLGATRGGDAPAALLRLLGNPGGRGLQAEQVP